MWPVPARATETLTRETVRRAPAAALTGLTLMLTAGPALAASDPLGPREGAEPAEPMSLVAWVSLYVLLPVALVLVIAAIVWLPGAVKANRYRPNRPWLARPVWFAGPADPVAAVQSAQPGELPRGGAGGNW